MMTRMTRFWKGSRGAVSIEGMLAVPVLVWAMVAMPVFFDAFRQQNLAMKASYTVADMVSRATDALVPADIDGLAAVFDDLTFSREPGWLRVTSLRRDAAGVPRVIWSRATGGEPALTDGTLAEHDHLVPVMATGDTVVLLETFLRYDPPFNVGIGSGWTANAIVTRPRFASQVVFDPAG
jgi:hypothetical protein